MKTELGIRTAAFRLIDSAITLKNNENIGCPTSGDELEAMMPRIEKIRDWMIANNQRNYISNYFSYKNYGLDRIKFVANDMVDFLNGDKKYF